MSELKQTLRQLVLRPGHRDRDAAGYLPARRAAKVAPMEALRYE